MTPMLSVITCIECCRWPVQVDTKVWTESKTRIPELPADLSTVPLLVFDVDRGPTVATALHFLQDKQQLLIAWKQDEDHDDWNCTKWACNHASWFPWRVICMLAPVFTMNVAPFQTGGLRRAAGGGLGYVREGR